MNDILQFLIIDIKMLKVTKETPINIIPWRSHLVSPFVTKIKVKAIVLKTSFLANILLALRRKYNQQEYDKSFIFMVTIGK